MAILNFPDPNVTTVYEENGVIYTWDGQKWTANTTAAFLPISGGTLTGDLTVPSLNGGPLAGMRNVLINGDFRVWQRGEAQTPIPPGESPMQADRWYTRSTPSIGNNCTQGLFQDGNVSKHRFVASSALANGYIVQKIEAQNIRDLEGQQVTLSYYSSYSSPAVFIETLDSTGAVTTLQETPISLGNNRYYATFTLPSGQLGIDPTSEGARVVIYYSQGGVPTPDGNYDTWNVQLEPGPVATPFEMRPIGLELQLAHRYYYQSPTIFASRIATNNAADVNAVANCQFTNYMRVNPTIVPTYSQCTETATPGANIGGARFRVTPTSASAAYLTFTADAEL